uniref:Uncharacterized protein n=1 Tax=Romanomermis culicivorax TaxID=13658 RepID=A0A915KWK6_ROMCU
MEVEFYMLKLWAYFLHESRILHVEASGIPLYHPHALPNSDHITLSTILSPPPASPGTLYEFGSLAISSTPLYRPTQLRAQTLMDGDHASPAGIFSFQILVLTDTDRLNDDHNLHLGMDYQRLSEQYGRVRQA